MMLRRSLFEHRLRRSRLNGLIRSVDVIDGVRVQVLDETRQEKGMSLRDPATKAETEEGTTHDSNERSPSYVAQSDDPAALNLMVAGFRTTLKSKYGIRTRGTKATHGIQRP